MSHRYSFLNAEVPDKEEMKQKTTNPATGELQERLEQAGVMDLWQRFRQQTPQCRYGLSGTCCNSCLWGFSGQILHYMYLLQIKHRQCIIIVDTFRWRCTDAC